MRILYRLPRSSYRSARSTIPPASSSWFISESIVNTVSTNPVGKFWKYIYNFHNNIYSIISSDNLCFNHQCPHLLKRKSGKLRRACFNYNNHFRREILDTDIRGKAQSWVSASCSIGGCLLWSFLRTQSGIQRYCFQR